MKALTIHQPYASMIALGLKRTEYRTWRTHYRGPLAIHAAARKPHDYAEIGFYDEWMLGPVEDLPRGAIVAYVELVACVPLEIPEEGPPIEYGWKLADIHPIEPKPYKGQQGLWNLSTIIEAKIREVEDG